MLNLNDRLFGFSGAISPGGPSVWHITDWDQRRLVSVMMDEEQEEEDEARGHLLKYINDLPPDVHQIHVSPTGELISVSNDPKDDPTYFPYYPPLSEVQNPNNAPVVSRADLYELDRLGPMVDLVICPRSEPTRQLVFKYYFHIQRLRFIWHEMNLWMRLPKHPHIVPFDKIVVDELEGRLVGFTTLYIPGGTLEENTSRMFKLKWLHQLTSVVDELNLNLGIAHQDVAARNLVIDETTDSLMIFDFNFSARIGKPECEEVRNDIKGVLFTMYEIITRHDDLRRVRHEEQDASVIEQAEWVKHPDVLLDHPVSEFRKVLTEWCQKRKNGEKAGVHTDTPNFVDWPPLPDAPLSGIEFRLTDGTTRTEFWKRDMWRRSELREKGKTILNWQRRAQVKLEPRRLSGIESKQYNDQLVDPAAGDFGDAEDYVRLGYVKRTP
ncbi:protein kinase-like protein [Pochonia chlamydosporia 170]|uniref:Protein kinase-like protein n=1 Tax=Pochonia chlamydosporia 170 TaxID=1380566 RepID=A0A179FBY1_METCM|nr:protein kinase-like protein [Pochonia chlamydosporia 170]OAQ62976.1 protein kinase-like protein [Pochonia chlamydosporia 170]